MLAPGPAQVACAAAVQCFECKRTPTCNNHGDCNGLGNCVCDTHWTGTYCSEPAFSACSPLCLPCLLMAAFAFCASVLACLLACSGVRGELVRSQLFHLLRRRNHVQVRALCSFCPLPVERRLMPLSCAMCCCKHSGHGACNGAGACACFAGQCVAALSSV